VASFAGSYTAGGSVYSTATGLAITPAGTSGQVLMSNGAAAPSWQTVDDNTKLPLDGSDAMTGNLTMGGFDIVDAAGVTISGGKVFNLTDPTANQEAATKAYVDSTVSGAGGRHRGPNLTRIWAF